MKGIFVADNGCVKYAIAIVKGGKVIETRSRKMLSACVGERVAIIRTREHHKPCVVGYAKIVRESFCRAEDFDKFFDLHLVQPGSKYACHGKGKWFYWFAKAEECRPYELPGNAVRHGRSWCEWDNILDVLCKAEAEENAMTDEDWQHLHDGEVYEKELF